MAGAAFSTCFSPLALRPALSGGLPLQFYSSAAPPRGVYNIYNDLYAPYTAHRNRVPYFAAWMTCRVVYIVYP